MIDQRVKHQQRRVYTCVRSAVLPQHAGLDQLVAAGQLSIGGTGGGVGWGRGG